MVSSSVSPESDDPGSPAAQRHRERLVREFEPIPGVHEPYSEESRHCRVCSAHFGIAVLFPCLSYQAQRRDHRHGEDAGAES